ncbi:hypothetical protein [Merismopedia glauca]|uniref:DUF4367 domain-containing protein n=1 Tax=Merismopedia glauca CCAP 1448/3 TaxID=1296344 RepID=A0A2T1C0C6_9CYAN|nr:hypothetical protein [Merismopedia glauca]PSB01618.1 hypothetical protein C7B64_17415 [Merismopedia glauca CCAP 1448/3]
MIYSQLFASSLVGVSLLANLSSATAAPAPIFQPIISELQSKLPSGWKLRLPAYLPSAPVQLYAYVRSSPVITQVNIATSPDCATSSQPLSCTVGGIGVISPQRKNWLPAQQKFSRVSLSRGIKGYYLTRDGGKFIFWEQEGQRYTLGAIAQGISTQDLIEIVNSAINESPISSRRR